MTVLYSAIMPVLDHTPPVLLRIAALKEPRRRVDLHQSTHDGFDFGSFYRVAKVAVGRFACFACL